MSRASEMAVLLLACSFSGCEMRPMRHAGAKTPPAPAPVVAKKEPVSQPPAVTEPLSIPQTQVQLPPPQPIDPEALAPPPVPAVADQPQQKTPRRTAARHTAPNPAPATAKPEPVETADAPPTEPTRPRVEPVMPADQRRQTIEDIAARLKDVEQTIGRLSYQRLSEEEKASVGRVKSMVALSRQASDRGDIQQAGELAVRAFLLAQDLARGR